MSIELGDVILEVRGVGFEISGDFKLDLLLRVKYGHNLPHLFIDLVHSLFKSFQVHAI